jgi:hypothetical protein
LRGSGESDGADRPVYPLPAGQTRGGQDHRPRFIDTEFLPRRLALLEGGRTEPVRIEAIPPEAKGRIKASTKPRNGSIALRAIVGHDGEAGRALQSRNFLDLAQKLHRVVQAGVDYCALKARHHRQARHHRDQVWSSHASRGVNLMPLSRRLGT